MKNITNWNELERRKATNGDIRVMYELRNYYIIVSDANYLPGGYSISARPVTRDSYSPSIYIDATFETDVQEIKIQTTSYGSLDISEIDNFVECYKNAQAVAQEIKSAFPECFA